ncbi:MAG: TrkH family potassium uptake protein [Clostridia bacterium]|nr:TrkH family potassium uptake protein [Clostridia bacterium]
MNVKFVFRITALCVFFTSLFMLAPAIIAFIDAQYRYGFIYLGVVAVMLIFSGIIFWLTRNYKPTFYAQEGFAATSLSWILMSFLGAVPFKLTGEIPSYIDALFEIVSGFTTTGASILTDIEALSRCNLYWRSFSHWLGGMGVLVFLLAIVPSAKKESGSGIFLMRAESPGPSVGKFTPHIRQTAIILYVIYVLLTAMCVILLLVGGMPVFDSLCTAFGTAGTGGFSVLNSSMAGYCEFCRNVVTVFMFLFGVNFNMYFLLLLRQFKSVFKNSELRAYVITVVSSIVLITLNIRNMFGSFSQALHHAAFQVSSIITTTGFASDDFEQWPAFSKSILFILMFIGACAGSTGGGLKVSRVILLFKSIWKTIIKTLRPRKVHIVRMDSRTVDASVTHGVNSYLAIYCVIILTSFLIVSLDNYSLGTNLSAVVACFNNIGPGFELVGATENYSHFSNLSKIVLSCDMLLGRLEIFPLLVLFSPDLWSRKR